MKGTRDFSVVIYIITIMHLAKYPLELSSYQGTLPPCDILAMKQRLLS